MSEDIEALKRIKEKFDKTKDDPKFIEGLKKHMEEHTPIKNKDGVYRLDSYCYAVKRTLRISITVRGLTICPDWKKCEYHGKYNCKEIQIFNNVLIRLKEKRAEKESINKSLLEFLQKEVK